MADLAKKAAWLDSLFSHTTRLISSPVCAREKFEILLVQSIQSKIRNEKQGSKEVEHSTFILNLPTRQEVAERQEREPDDEIKDPFVMLSNHNGNTKRDAHVQFIDKAIEVNADTAYKSRRDNGEEVNRTRDLHVVVRPLEA